MAFFTKNTAMLIGFQEKMLFSPKIGESRKKQ
jgi:hypothetical protein